MSDAARQPRRRLPGRLLPASLFGRLTLVLLLGLTLMTLLSSWFLLQDRGDFLHRSIRADLVGRTAGIALLLDALKPDQRDRMLPLLNTPETRIGLADRAQPVEAAGEDARNASLWVAERLEARLPTAMQVRVALLGEADLTPPWPPGGRHFAGHPGPPAMAGRPRIPGMRGLARSFVIQIRLADGNWLWFERRVPEDLFDWPLRLLLTIGLLLLGVAALSLFAVSRLTRPLRELRRAADALGRDIHQPPLAEHGPAELVDTARAFNTMQSRIQRYLQDRSRILSAVSHDLKTPLTRLRLRAELLEEAQPRDKILADLDDMESMVSATLEFMRGSESAEAIQLIDLMSLLESLCEDAREAGWQVALSGTIEQPVKAKPLALKRCINNLLDNAVRYGGQAALSVREHADRLELQVADQGPGIPQEMLERVFDPFVRLEQSRNPESGGTGLGLGIARNLARAQGGDLCLRNGDHGGLLAILTLPR